MNQVHNDKADAINKADAADLHKAALLDKAVPVDKVVDRVAKAEDLRGDKVAGQTAVELRFTLRLKSSWLE